MKIWSEAGLVGLIIYAALLIFYPFISAFYWEDTGILLTIVTFLVFYPTQILVKIVPALERSFFLFILNFIFYFFIGTIIGRVCEKLKSRNQKG